jgi:hypothetical protein
VNKQTISLVLATVSTGVIGVEFGKFDPAVAQVQAPVVKPRPIDRALPATTKPVPKVKPANILPVIPVGTMMEGDLQKELSTGKNKNNDIFTLKIQNSSVRNYPILKDAVITGHLENVIKAARGKKAKMNLFFDTIELKNGDKIQLNAQLVNTKIEGKRKGTFLRNASIIIGGAIAGKFVGDKAKLKNGALTGAVASTAYVLSSPGGEVVLKKGTDIELKLKSKLDPN